MLFQGRVDRAMKFQKEQHEKPGEENKDDNKDLSDPRQEYEEEPVSKKLEKGDIPAMLISAMAVLIPAALIVMLLIYFLARVILNV